MSRKEIRRLHRLEIVALVLALVFTYLVIFVACSRYNNEKGTFEPPKLIPSEVAEETTQSTSNAVFESFEHGSTEEVTEGVEESVVETEEESTVADSPAQTEADAEEVLEDSITHVAEHWQVAGSVLDLELQDYLYKKLYEYGIEWWMPLACMQSFQESCHNPSAISYHSGEGNNDCGLFQFREKWWESFCKEAGYSGLDIMNPYHQIDVYTYHIHKWVEKGYTESKILSNWYNGESVYSEEYVNQVMRWLEYTSRL